MIIYIFMTFNVCIIILYSTYVDQIKTIKGHIYLIIKA